MDGERIVFLDWLRVAACFAVMLIHACEPFYFAADGSVLIANGCDAFWLTLVDGACRAAVPLFVMASAYLLFPVKRATGDFFKRRFGRVVIPFFVWLAVYRTFAAGWSDAAFNFPFASGHLWFVPMLLGCYLVMPLLSPWAEKTTEREARGWLVLWFFTTLLPLVRVFRTPDACDAFAPSWYFWGECPWNAYGLFHYVSGFMGYVLLGFYFRRFGRIRSWGAALARAIPLWLAGLAIVWSGFYFRIPAGWPATGPYALAVELERTWEFCSFGVALTVVAYFMLARKIASDGVFYRRVIRPLSEASYGTYLAHMIFLPLVLAQVRGILPVPVVFFATAAGAFLCASGMSLVLRALPFVGKYLG